MEIWKPLKIEEYQGWINVLEHEASDELTPWETDFIESISGQLDSGRNLTEKQAVVLERIYAQKTK